VTLTPIRDVDTTLTLIRRTPSKIGILKPV